jgi:hypothetical protein
MTDTPAKPKRVRRKPLPESPADYVTQVPAPAELTLLDRFGVALGEPSTWRGAAMILSSFGVVISPEHLNVIIAGGMFASGLIGVFFKSQH